MGGWGVFLGLRIFFLKIFHPKIKSVQNGLKCKKTHKIFFSSEKLLPPTGPESNGPGQEYLDNLGLGHLFSGPGLYSTDWSGFEAFNCNHFTHFCILNFFGLSSAFLLRIYAMVTHLPSIDTCFHAMTSLTTHFTAMTTHQGWMITEKS